MNYANIKNCDIANGPGVRGSLFVSGCTHHCPGCFNEVAWDCNYGSPFTEKEIEKIIGYLTPSYISGLTLLGGEPFEPENQRELVKLLKRVRETYPDKDIWSYSGYIYDVDMAEGGRAYTEVTKEMLSYLDVLVDGPFVQELKDITLKFRGSKNQRIIKLENGKDVGRLYNS